MTNRAQNQAQSAANFPDRPALRPGASTLTYAEFDDLDGRAAGRMAALGVQPGDRVGPMVCKPARVPGAVSRRPAKRDTAGMNAFT